MVSGACCHNFIINKQDNDPVHNVNRCTDSFTHGGGCVLSLACPGVHMMPCCAIFTVVSLARGKVMA